MARIIIVCLLLALATVAMSYPSAPAEKETLQAENSFGLGYGLYGGGLGHFGGLGFGGLGLGLGLQGAGLYGLGLYGR